MRQDILALNAEHRGLLFDVGSSRYAAPPRVDDAVAQATWEADLAKVREESAKTTKAAAAEREGDRTHTEIQGWLRDLGRAFDYDVWIASNDRGRPYGGKLGEGCLERPPEAIGNAPGADAVRLVDVLWLDCSKTHVAAAFEVEHSTSIYSGIVHMLDLALGTEAHPLEGMFLVTPNGRKKEVRTQLARPAFSRVADLKTRYLPYGEPESHRVSMARFGSGMKAIHAISRTLV
ncbi:hypothetical protein FBY14_102337 [Azospirillum brasilense]|nr:hypothetical protein FBY14_102337 [Azospirillum brasilense]